MLTRFSFLVANDVHQHTRRRMHDYEVPVQLTNLSHIGQHVPATANAGRRDRHHQHAVRNKSVEHKLFRFVTSIQNNM